MIGVCRVRDSFDLVCVLARLPTGAADDVRRKQEQVGSKHQHDKGQSVTASPLYCLQINIFKKPQQSSSIALI